MYIELDGGNLVIDTGPHYVLGSFVFGNNVKYIAPTPSKHKARLHIELSVEKILIDTGLFERLGKICFWK